MSNDTDSGNSTEIPLLPSYDADYMHSFGVKVSIFSSYAVVFLFGCLTNTLMLVIGIRHQISDLRLDPATRHGKGATQRIAFSVTNVLVTNMAAADIVLCVFSLVFTPVSYYAEEWPFGELGCKILPSTSIVSICVISFTSTTIAIDRLLAICYPHSPRLTVRSALVCLVALWIFSISWGLPLVMNLATKYEAQLNVTQCAETWSSAEVRKLYSSATLIIQFGIPTVIICCCYIKIGLKLRARSKQYGTSSMLSASRILTLLLTVQNGNALTLPQRSTLIAEDKKTLRTIRILIAMVVIFMICWLPINALLLVADVSEENVWASDEFEWFPLAYFAAHIMAMSSTLWNPLLYGWMNGKLRLKMIETFLPRKRSASIKLPLREIPDQNSSVAQHLLSQNYGNDVQNGAVEPGAERAQRLRVTFDYSIASSMNSVLGVPPCADAESLNDPVVTTTR